MKSYIISYVVSRGQQQPVENKRKPLTQKAYQTLKDEILDQKLLPRQALVEAELASQYGMSKTPVREALVTLAREGLVEIDAFRGGRVRDFTSEDVREIYELREVLEPFALERSAPVMDEEDRQNLRRILEEAESAMEESQQRKLARLNRAFHNALFTKCGNSRVIETLSRMQDQIQAIALRFWRMQASYLEEAEQHNAVLEAIEANNPRQAAELLREHIAEAREKYIRQWD